MFMVMMIVLVEVRAGLDLALSGEDEDVAAGAYDLNRRAVEPREHGRRDHVFDRAECRLGIAEIEHPVDRAEKLVQFMGAEQDGDLQFAAEPAREVDDRSLIARVEADQRLVAEEGSRAAAQI